MKLQKFDESFVRIQAPNEVLYEIRDYFTFKVPGYQFSPKFKAKLWDGNVSLFDIQRGKLPLGLLDLLLNYAKKVHEEVVYINDGPYTFDKQDINFLDFQEFVNYIILTNDRGERIYAKEYQIEAAWKALCAQRLTLKMPTGSGKSLTIYLIIRWLLEHDKRVCMIVPSISLVRQMLSDFREYSIENGFDVDNVIAGLYSGQEKDFSKPVLISTWQSLSKLMKFKHGVQALNSYDGIIVDEAHCAKGKELQSILEKATEVKYRIGTTGTIDKQKINELTIIGQLGPIETIITTKELIDSGSLSGLTITALALQYDEDTCKAMKKTSYEEELTFLFSSKRRTNVIRNLALATEGCTLILCQRVEAHLVPIYDAIVEKAGDRPVYMISGQVDPIERERIRKFANQHPNCILVATYQTCQQGINIPRIDTVIFASPSKSSIRVLQSIGRGLRLHGEKDGMVLIDIVDDLRYKKHENTTYEHFLERMKIYRAESFDVQIKEYKIG